MGYVDDEADDDADDETDDDVDDETVDGESKDLVQRVDSSNNPTMMTATIYEAPSGPRPRAHFFRPLRAAATPSSSTALRLLQRR